MRCFIVQSPNLEEEEDSTINMQRETGRDTEKERECTQRDTETKTQRERERESTGETGSLSRKCNLHQKLKVPVVLGWELHASPTKTFFYLWGKGSNIVQKYETQTDRQFQQIQIERNLLQLQWGCCESREREREREREFREMEGGGGRG
jgi:hypothetical protein